MECFIIGRDLVRLLQIVARIPEMELLWKDLLHNPQALSPQFTGKGKRVSLSRGGSVCVWETRGSVLTLSLSLVP